MLLKTFLITSLFSLSALAADTVRLERTIEVQDSEDSIASTTSCSIDTDSVDTSVTSKELGATTTTSKSNTFVDIGSVEQMINDVLAGSDVKTQLNSGLVSKTYTVFSADGSATLLKIDGPAGTVTKNDSEAATRLRSNIDLLCN